MQRGHCQTLGGRLARRIVNLRLRLESTVTLRAMLQSDFVFMYEIQPRPSADQHRYEVTCTRTILLRWTPFPRALLTAVVIRELQECCPYGLFTPVLSVPLYFS